MQVQHPLFLLTLYCTNHGIRPACPTSHRGCVAAKTIHAWVRRERAMRAIWAHSDSIQLRHDDPHTDVKRIHTADAVPGYHELAQIVAWDLNINQLEGLYP